MCKVILLHHVHTPANVFPFKLKHITFQIARQKYYNCKFTHLSRGDSEIVQRKGVVALLWLDNRVVTLLSTNAQPSEIDQVQRKQHDGTRVNVRCPAAMALYNRFMGGVDRNDQLRQYYHVRLKGRKFYKYIFWFYFEVSVANAYILMKNYTEKCPKAYKDFRLSLAKALVGDYYSRKRPGRATTICSSLPIRHFPVKEKKNRCWYCAHVRQQPRRRETKWFCHECQLYLCHTGLKDGSDCFMLHHK